MTYAERQTMNNLTANQQFYNTRTTINFADMAASGAVGTVVAIDGLTGRAIASIADGMARYTDISGSNQQGVTNPAFSGKFSDGKQ
jgi:hypothetical protein